MKGFPRRGSDFNHRPADEQAVQASMKGFPRRGSDGATPHSRRQHCRLNEGLPQKGKRCMPADMAIIDDPASMKGFPRRGSDVDGGAGADSPCPASMKGFPRRGSDYDRMLDTLGRWVRPQ